MSNHSEAGKGVRLNPMGEQYSNNWDRTFGKLVDEDGFDWHMSGDGWKCSECKYKDKWDNPCFNCNIVSGRCYFVKKGEDDDK